MFFQKYDYYKIVTQNIVLGFNIFLLTEIIIFGSLFWCWLYSSINPAIWVGGVWPPVGIEAPNPLGLPLYNTFILFTSSCSLVWMELALQIRSRESEVLLALVLTISAGTHFLLCQILEFTRLPFNYADSIYSSLFYSITGLHFLHIIVGLVFLLLTFIRVFYKN